MARDNSTYLCAQASQKVDICELNHIVLGGGQLEERIVTHATCPAKRKGDTNHLLSVTHEGVSCDMGKSNVPLNHSVCIIIFLCVCVEWIYEFTFQDDILELSLKISCENQEVRNTMVVCELFPPVNVWGFLAFLRNLN